jgi:hypothetical protein
MPDISRAKLVWAVEKAAPHLADEGDRNAVMHFARTTRFVAAGAWVMNVEGGPDNGGTRCRCPASAVGIDRMQQDAQNFAAAFDDLLEVEDDELVFEVVDAIATTSKEKH